MPSVEYIAEDLRPLALPVADLVEDPRNANEHNDTSVDAIAASLRRFGQRKPIVVQMPDRIVRAGNGTLRAARKLGWSHVAVVRVTEDDTSATGFAIADNRTAELSHWNKEQLDQLLTEIDGQIGDIDLESMFDNLAEELAKVIVDEKPSAGSADKDTTPGSSVSESPMQYRILIECGDDAQQRALLERFKTEGLTCRALIV